MDCKNVVMNLPIAVDVNTIEATVEKAVISELSQLIEKHYFNKGYRNAPSMAMEVIVEHIVDKHFSSNAGKAMIVELVADRLVEKLIRSKKFREDVADAINGGD